jgi:hypothetical protein
MDKLPNLGRWINKPLTYLAVSYVSLQFLVSGYYSCARPEAKLPRYADVNGDGRLDLIKQEIVWKGFILPRGELEEKIYFGTDINGERFYLQQNIIDVLKRSRR